MSLPTHSPLRLPSSPATSSLFGPQPQSLPRLSRRRSRNYRLVWAQSGNNNMDFIRKLSTTYFMDRSSKEQLESVSGGQDVFDPTPDEQADHLVIMVNGIVGR